MVAAVPATETPVPATGTPGPTTALPKLVSVSDGSASSGSTSGSADAAVALPDGDGSAENATNAGDGTGTLSSAKLIVIIVLSAAGACVMLALLGWCCTRKYRARRSKTAAAGLFPSALPVVVPGPEGVLGGRYDLPGGQYDRSASNAMIAVMGDPVDDKRLSTGHQRSRATSRASRKHSNASDPHRPSHGVLAPAYRLSRPLGSSTPPSSLRGTTQLEHPAISTSRGSAASRLLGASPYRGIDYIGGGVSDTGSSAEDRPSYSSLVEFHQSACGEEGILTASGIIRTSTTAATRAVAAPESPTLAVLELHRFSSTSSTASMSSLSSFPRPDQRLGASRVRSIVVRDLTQPTAEGDFRSSAGSSSLSSSVGDLGFSDSRGPPADGDTARLEWYNSIKSPVEDDRYTRLSLGESDAESDGERRSGGGDRQSYEL